MKKSLLGAAVVSLALVLATAASAQAPQVRVRGTIESVSGQMLTVKSRDGADMKIKLADNAPVRTVTKASLSDIKPGSFVGITAMPQPDGTQKAVEIHIFPEAMRGTGEGHRPWDLMPNSTMTNATVDTQVVISDGQKLVLKYKDGDKTFIVPSNVTVVSFTRHRKRSQAGRRRVRRHDQGAGRYARCAEHHGRHQRRQPADVSG